MNRLLILLSLVALTFVAACGGGGSKRVAVRQGSGPSFGDSQPHAWTGGHPYDHQVHGLDISRWQGRINWDQVRASGVSFLFIKATEGGDHSDPAFQTYWRESGQARIPRGAYHYFYFCRSGAQQAAWFIANVPRERGALPPVLDIEWTPTSRTCPGRPSGQQILQEANSFMNILQAYYGQRPIIYTTVDFYRETPIRQLNADFWLRSTAGHPRDVYPGQRWTFWQYTSTGLVPGINGNVDINVFAGNAATWRRWLQQRLQ